MCNDNITDLRLSCSSKRIYVYFFNSIFDCDVVDHGVDWFDCWPHMLCNVNFWLEDQPSVLLLC